MPVVDAAADVVGELGFQQLRNAAREFDDFKTARHFSSGIGQHLAVLARNRGSQIVVMNLDQFLELRQNARPFQRRRISPGRCGGTGGGDRSIDFCHAAQRHVAGDRTGRRVEHVLPALAGRIHNPAIDVMVDPGRRR